MILKRLCLSLAVAVTFVPMAGSQSRGSGNAPLGPDFGTSSPIESVDFASATRRLKALSEKRQSEERQKKMVEETNRLLQLANELQSEVSRSGSEKLSDSQMQKMNEIERLARSVKERMKG